MSSKGLYPIVTCAGKDVEKLEPSFAGRTAIFETATLKPDDPTTLPLGNLAK